MHNPDRRASSRSTTRFQPACIKIDGVVSVALMRDLTSDGAGFESDLELVCGQPVSYRWGNESIRYGHVIWTANGRFGVQNRDGDINPPGPQFPYRSVRVPTSLPATVFANSARYDGEIVNLAHRGLCLLVTDTIVAGSLVTVAIGQNVLETLTIKWSNEMAHGVALAQPLKLRDMCAILRNAAA